MAGIKIPAHPEFRFVRHDERGRLDLRDARVHPLAAEPQILVDFPEQDEERAILEAQVPFADGGGARVRAGVPAPGPRADLRYTVRDGINLVRYAIKLLAADDRHPARGGDARRR